MNIPAAALEAGARALAADAHLNWDDIPQTHNILRGEARAAFLAMIEAWLGMEIDDSQYGGDFIILPLPTEASDE